jgi:hypothetical protein
LDSINYIKFHTHLLLDFIGGNELTVRHIPYVIEKLQCIKWVVKLPEGHET